MSVYANNLPNAFPYVVEVRYEDIDTWTTFLNTAMPRSSYAVTSDNYREEGYVHLWLSKVSVQRLAAEGLYVHRYSKSFRETRNVHSWAPLALVDEALRHGCDCCAAAEAEYGGLDEHKNRISIYACRKCAREDHPECPA